MRGTSVFAIALLKWETCNLRFWRLRKRKLWLEAPTIFRFVGSTRKRHSEEASMDFLDTPELAWTPGREAEAAVVVAGRRAQGL